MHAVGYNAGQFVAVGEVDDRAAVWTSADGATWRLTPRPIATFGAPGQYSAMYALTWFHGRWYAGGDFAAGGTVAQVAAIWTSTDGVAWQRTTPATESIRVPGDRPYIVHLAATGDGIVGAGTNPTLVPGGGQSCDIWFSTDGANWFVPNISVGSLSPAGQACALTSVTFGHGRWVAVGIAGGVGQAWTSQDAFSWSLATNNYSGFTNSYGATEVNDVVVTERGWLAVGDDPGPAQAGDAAVWDSSDAKTWVRVYPDGAVFGGPDRQVMAAATVGPAGIVAGGWDRSTGSARGAVWLRTP